MASRLDLKYRPRKFAEVLGNDGVVQLLLKRSADGTLTDQSMLFGGPKGVGKTTLARLVAMAIVCRDKEAGEPCGSCNSCQSILDETSSAVEELDAASQGTVDRIRDMIQDAEYEVPDGIGNIYILDEAQRLTQAAQDTMLKAVENRSIMVMMCTTEPHKIKEALRSRAEEYPIAAPPIDQLVSKLVKICELEGIQHDPEALRIIARMTQSCPRVCIKAIETMSVMGPVDIAAARKFLRFDSYEAVDRVLARIDDQPRAAIDAFDALVDREGAAWVRDAMVLAISSGLRVDAGAKPSYPVPTTFFQTRLRKWSDFARQIGVVEKPTPAGLLAALLSTPDSCAHQAPSLAPHPPVIPSPPASMLPPPPPAKASPTPESKQEPEPKPKPVEQLEIDGVTFSRQENLTTLDSKIGSTPSGPPPPATDSEPGGVEFRSDKVPMPDREFARGFISRFRK